MTKGNGAGDSERATAAYILAHPLRQRIITILRDGEELSIKEISEQVSSDETIVGFHLVSLEQHGLVGRVMRYANPAKRAESRFSRTGKVAEALDALRAVG